MSPFADVTKFGGLAALLLCLCVGIGEWIMRRVEKRRSLGMRKSFR